jgi:hypothetical protein
MGRAEAETTWRLDGHPGDFASPLTAPLIATDLAVRAAKLPDGTVIWTSPTGQTYRTNPAGAACRAGGGSRLHQFDGHPLKGAQNFGQVANVRGRVD